MEFICWYLDRTAKNEHPVNWTYPGAETTSVRADRRDESDQNYSSVEVSTEAELIWPPTDQPADLIIDYIVRALCIFGIVSNILNIIILVKKIREGIDNLERGATVGLAALAVSDLGFCIFSLIESFVPQHKVIFPKKNLAYFMTLYGTFAINIFIKTSTSFTVVLAVGRYYAVCFPMRARQYMRCGHTVIAIIFSPIFWILLHLPLLWSWNVKEVQCSINSKRQTVYTLISGEFSTNKNFQVTMTYIWAGLGFFLPVAILAYCNYKLVKSLQHSTRLRRNSGSQGPTLRTMSRTQRRISLTLIGIVIMFFILICPSEIVHLYGDIGKFLWYYIAKQLPGKSSKCLPSNDRASLPKYYTLCPALVHNRQKVSIFCMFHVNHQK